MDCNTKKQKSTQAAAKLQFITQSFIDNNWAAPFGDARNRRIKQILIKSPAQNFLLNTKLTMAPDSELSKSIIHAIDFIPNQVVPSLGGVDMPNTYSQGLFVIVDQCDEDIITMPMQDLNSFANGNKVMGMRVVRPVWNECYLLLTGAGLTTANGILMQVYYSPAP